MRRQSVLFLLAMACTPSTPTLDAAHRLAIIDSVETRLTAFRAAVGGMQADSVAQFYLADSTFRWIEDGEVRYHSRAEVATAIRDAAPFMSDASLLYDGTVITPLAPGVASIVTGFAQKFTTPDGQRAGFAGAITAVMVDTPDGWMFQSGHTSSVHPRQDSVAVTPAGGAR
ncbi:MAG TPA: hypothetical protein VFN22_06920 [Gemmatimonadales bacterium]|nr:hypothetical protein [Gemmatimonadales bacterium]